MHFLHKNICWFPNWFIKLFLKTTSYKLRMSLSYTRFPRNRVWDKNLCWRCSRKGLRVDSCLTLRNELSKETHILTKWKTLLQTRTWSENCRVREPRRAALPCTLMWKRSEGLHSELLWRLLVHQVCFCFWFTILAGASVFQIISLSTVVLAYYPLCSGFRRKTEKDKNVKREHCLAWNNLSRNLPCYFQLCSVSQNPASGHTPRIKERKAKMYFSWTHFHL